MDNKFIKYMAVGVGIFIIIMCLGIALTSIMSFISRADTTADVNSITVATNGSLTNFGSSYPYVQDVAGCINASGTATLAAANYSVVTGSSLGNGGFVLSDSGSTFSGWSVNCTGVRYLKSTTASNGITALLVIFATIGSLAVLFVLIMIIKPFMGMMKK